MQGVANRDIKLENTLLDSTTRPLIKICDFGYSKVSPFAFKTVPLAAVAPSHSQMMLCMTPMFTVISCVQVCACFGCGL